MISASRHIEAMEKINSLISVRERCVKETRERLNSCGFNQEEIDDAIETALRVGLLSEERYTRAYIRGKTNAGWGRRKIEYRLHMSGIQDQTIQACEDEFSSPAQEYERALSELRKRPTRSANPYGAYMRRLVAKGFSQDLASRAVKDFMDSSTD